MKKLLITLAIALTANLQLRADIVPVSEAQTIASQFLQKNSARRARVVGKALSPSAELKLSTVGDASSYYIFNVGTDEGFVVVSGDDATEEILGYSYSGHIHPDSMPCNMRMLFNSYTDQIKFLREHGITKEMNSPRKNGPKKELETPSYMIDEYRRCSFDQVSPYNDYCPIVDGIHSLTGCTATALAGLMYAYKWPNYTTKRIPSYQNNPSLIEYMFDFFVKDDVEAIPAHTRIDWPNILPKYGNRVRDESGKIIRDENGQIKLDVFRNITSEQKAAVASLMKLAGTSIKAVYSPSGTDAPLSNVPSALISYFGYDNHVFYDDCDNYDRETWRGMLRNEILNRGPVMYRGTEKVTKDGKTEYSGHAFLLEGFEDHYFYVNFGWSGETNGKFLLDIFEGEGTLLYYNINQGAVFNVLPLPLYNLEITGVNIDKGSINERSFYGPTLRGTLTITNKDARTFADTVSLKLFNGLTEKGQIGYNLEIAAGESVDVDFEFRGLKVGQKYTLKAWMGEDMLQFYESPALESHFAVPDIPDNESADVANHDLTHYEYWFDDDYGSRQRVSISGTRTNIVEAVNTEALSHGLHYFNVRLQQDDGEYSPVSSTQFMKSGVSNQATKEVEYWFDDDFDNRLTADLSGSPLEVDDAVGTDQLGNGLHRLNARVKYTDRVNAVYSPVSTTPFFKYKGEAATKVVYWFDEDYAHRAVTPLPAKGSNGLTSINFDLSDMTRFPLGLHRMHLCFATSENKVISSVYKFLLLKMVSGSVNQIEYWVDDDFNDGRKTVDGTFEAKDGEYVFVDPFDLSGVPFGSHTVNYRAVVDGGSIYSPVSSAHVIKIGRGKADKIEYWVDGDTTTVKTVTGTLDTAEGAYVFVDPFDLSGVTNGLHRVFYRVAAENGEPGSAIGMMPVIVKSMYGPGPALMTQYRIVADDDTELASGTLNLKQEAELNLTLDASSLGEGEHKLQATFWNSFGGSTTTDWTPFWVRGPLTGDVNRDGQVGIGDIVAVTNFMAGSAGGVTLMQADVNGDGDVGIGDIVAITNIMAGAQ